MTTNPSTNHPARPTPRAGWKPRRKVAAGGAASLIAAVLVWTGVTPNDAADYAKILAPLVPILVAYFVPGEPLARP